MNWRALVFLLGSSLLWILVGFLAAYAFRVEPRKKSAVIQAAFRSNAAVIGLALVSAISGENEAMATAFMALVIGFAAIINNAVGVILLSANTGPEKKRVPVTTILKNPLLIGAMSGLVFLALKNLGVFSLAQAAPRLLSAVASLAKTASPIALFCLGAVLDFQAIHGMRKELAVGVSLRLIVCPALTLGLAILFLTQLGITKAEMPGILALSATPVAVSSAAMIQEMGGDAQLANHLVVWSSVLSMITLFVFIVVLKNAGLL